MNDVQKAAKARAAKQSKPIGSSFETERQREKRAVFKQIEGSNGANIHKISHNFDPAMTIRGNSITFNNACISKLENATYVQFLINPAEQRLLIRPCDEGARDAVRWCIVREDKRKSRQISCQIFIEKLREMMGWEDVYRYRLQGMRIDHNGEALYMFDLSSNECFLPQKRDPETGKLIRSKPKLSPDLLDGFGMSVEEHAASTQVDLSRGYVSAEVISQEDALPLITAQIE